MASRVGRATHEADPCTSACVDDNPVTVPSVRPERLVQEEEPAARPPGVRLLETLGKGVALIALSAALVFGGAGPAAAARSAGRAGGFAGGGMSRSYGGGGGGGSSRGGGGGGGGGMTRSFGTYSSPFSSYSPYSAPTLRSSTVIISPGYSPGLGAYSSPTVVTGGALYPQDITAVVELLLLAFVISKVLEFAGQASGLAQRTGSDAAATAPTLVRVRVGLLANARSIKRQLDGIAARADTSDQSGLQHMLQETVLALLRNPNHCVYGSAATQAAASAADLERRFSAASVSERSKFEQETLVNVRGARGVVRSPLRPPGGSSGGGIAPPDELLVVTLLVAAAGAPPGLPQRIDSADDLKAALAALGGLPASQVLGVELLWTPQAEGDYYTREEIAVDYPELRSL